MPRRLALLLVVSITAFAAETDAQIVYGQTLVGPSFAVYSNDSVGIAVADNFVVTEAWDVIDVRFWGSTFNGLMLEAPLDDILGFQIYFFKDGGGGAPGDTLYMTTIGTGSSALNSVLGVDGLAFAHRITVKLPDDVRVFPGDTYWLSVVALMDPGAPDSSWGMLDTTAGLDFRYYYNDGTWHEQPEYDLAFELYGRLASDCPVDLTTTNANPGDQTYGFPDGNVNGADLSFFVENWLKDDQSIADITTTNANPGEPGYGIADDIVNGADLSVYVEGWLDGCF